APAEQRAVLGIELDSPKALGQLEARPQKARWKAAVCEPFDSGARFRICTGGTAENLSRELEGEVGKVGLGCLKRAQHGSNLELSRGVLSPGGNAQRPARPTSEAHAREVEEAAMQVVAQDLIQRADHQVQV